MSIAESTYILVAFEFVLFLFCKRQIKKWRQLIDKISTHSDLFPFCSSYVWPFAPFFSVLVSFFSLFLNFFFYFCYVKSSVRTSTTPNTSTVISTTNSTNQTAQQQQQQQQQPQQQYVHVTTNQIPIEHINLEYLSNVNVSEDAQCLLDISNNTNAINSHHHAPQPTPTAQQTQQIATSAQHNASQQSGQTQTHQSLAAQHIQQFKIEYPSEETNYADDGEEVIVSQCAVAVEAAPTSIENSSIANYDGHTHTLTQAATSTTLAVAPAQLRNIGTTATKKIYHQVINSNGLITSTPHQLMTTSIKRQRLETHAAAQNSEQPEYNEAITAAVDYFKQQTATGDADAAFAKYILEELRGMNKKRKNDFKRMVATWLTTEDDEAGLE